MANINEKECMLRTVAIKKEIEAVRMESVKQDEDTEKHFNEKFINHSRKLEELEDKMNNFVTWDKFKWVTASSFGFTSISFGCLFWVIMYTAGIQNEKLEDQKVFAKEQTIILKQVEKNQIVLNEHVKRISGALGNAEITFE